ncbi:MAG: acetyl/propionyl/methylcrotonyl-CoA carboxylase subunit alpha [Burkholderiaceae bacterium]
MTATTSRPLTKILIANRGEIACRVIATCRKMGIRSVAVYSEADRTARHVQLADEAIAIGASEPKASYLNIPVLIAAAQSTGAQAIHPGYGFLSENPGFAQACTSAGIVFIGPSAQAIEAMGSKSAAKEIMQKAGVPLVPGYNGEDQSPEGLLAQAEKVGFPLLIKASAGGGGRGIRIVRAAEEFAAALTSCKRESLSSFGNDHVLLERYLSSARHIEVQVFGDTHGQVVHLFERDCSMQRRHQKVIEEAPAPLLTAEQRASLGAIAVRAAQAIGYTGAGTVEFIAEALPDGRAGACYFMEMNTRLQVEHPVTEMITGLDLVEWQIRVARGESLPLTQDQIRCHGHAIELRLCAEDPSRDFMPSTGRMTRYAMAPEIAGEVRIDSGLREGDTVSPYYDSMIAKLICWGEDRPTAIARAQQALAQTHLAGPTTNLRFLSRLLALPAFQNAELSTAVIASHQTTLTAPRPLSDQHLVLAVAAALQSGPWASAGPLSPTAHTPRDQSPDPWSLPNAFRITAPAQRSLRLSRDAEDWSVTVQWAPLAIGLGEALDPIDLLPTESPRQLAVCWRGQVLHGWADWERQPTVRLHLWTEDDDVLLQWDDPYATGQLDDDAEASLTAPMPGQVMRVHVGPGATVQKGEALLVISAMKMEFLVSAPRDGVVEALLCKEGDIVTEGLTLARLAPLAHAETPTPVKN